MTTNKFIIKMDPTALVPKSSARIYYYLSFWIAVLQAITVIVLWKYLPRVVPLYFTEPWGEGRLAPKFLIFLLPLLSLASIVSNLMLSKWAKGESPVLIYALAVSTMVIVLMLSIAMGGILQSIL